MAGRRATGPHTFITRSLRRLLLEQGERVLEHVEVLLPHPEEGRQHGQTWLAQAVAAQLDAAEGVAPASRQGHREGRQFRMDPPPKETRSSGIVIISPSDWSTVLQVFVLFFDSKLLL